MAVDYRSLQSPPPQLHDYLAKSPRRFCWSKAKLRTEAAKRAPLPRRQAGDQWLLWCASVMATQEAALRCQGAARLLCDRPARTSTPLCSPDDTPAKAADSRVTSEPHVPVSRDTENSMSVDSQGFHIKQNDILRRRSKMSSNFSRRNRGAKKMACVFATNAREKNFSRVPSDVCLARLARRVAQPDATARRGGCADSIGKTSRNPPCRANPAWRKSKNLNGPPMVE